MTESPSGSLGPVSAVLAELSRGAASLDEVSRVTGLSRESVDVAVAQLVRMGRVDARELTMGCPSGGCGSCASGSSEGMPGCGSAAPGPRRTGPVLVALSVRRP